MINSNIIDVENIKFKVYFESLIEIIIYTYENKFNEIH